MGREWRRKAPQSWCTYDFADKTLGKVNPYGVYDQTANVGWVSRVDQTRPNLR